MTVIAIIAIIACILALLAAIWCIGMVCAAVAHSAAQERLIEDAADLLADEYPNPAQLAQWIARYQKRRVVDR